MSWINENVTYYFYGMRLRGFAPGCQPIKGFKSALVPLEMIEQLKDYKDSFKRNYHDILIYDRQLTDTEIAEYELDYLCPIRLKDTKDEMREQGIEL